MVYDFEAIIGSLNKTSTDDLTYLSRHILLISVAINDTLSKDPVCLNNRLNNSLRC